MLTLAVSGGFLAFITRQLRLARTKDVVWTRNGYVGRADRPDMFAASVFFYWVALIWCIGMMIGIVISGIHEISN